MIFDKQQQMELAKKYPIPYLSYSQLNSFMNCPQTFKQTYLSGKFVSTGNKYTKLGNVLHDIFEQEGKMKIFGEEEKFLTQQEAIRMFNKNFMKVKDEHKEYFDDKEDFIKLYKKGITAIENYYEVYSSEAPLFVERKFMGQIAEGLPPFKSYIDRIEGELSDPSSWIITDYKTGGSPKSKDYLRKDIQMGLYVAQVYAETGHYPKAVQFAHPVPNKFQIALHQGDGVYKFTGQRAPVVEFSVANTLLIVRQTVAEIVSCIETGEFKKVVNPWDCKNCWHFDKCQPFVKNSGWENVGGK